MSLKIRINGAEVAAQAGSTILAEAAKAGAQVPTLCKHPSLAPIGSCRLCVVEVRKGGKSRVATSCNYVLKATDEGMEIFTDSEKAAAKRRENISKMLSRWPNVPVLRSLAEKYGVSERGGRHPKANLSETACVLCGICVSACEQIKKQQGIIVMSGIGEDRRVMMPGDEMNPNCLGCGICALCCPTGAISFDSSPLNEADFKATQKVAWEHSWEILTLDGRQNEMAVLGTTHLVPIMNAHDCLPVRNFQYGSDPEADKLDKEVYRTKFDRGFDGCWAGCAVSCAHGVRDFELRTGPYKGRKVFVDGPEYETIAGVGANCGIFDADFTIECNFYCDTYGLDTISAGTAMAFVMECFERGLINEKHTGGLRLVFGSQDAFMETLHQAARGEGFGRVFGQGIRRMKEIFEKDFGADRKVLDDIGMESKGLEFSEYITKESLAQQGGYGLALKGAQHDEAWLIFLDMVHNYMPTFEQKAEALHWFPMWRTWFSLNGLCKLPWNDIVPEDNRAAKEPAKVLKHVQNYARFFEGVTGIRTGPDDLIRQSERVYNFQRVFNLRMGYGRREHDRIPYRAMGPVTVEEYESRAERYDKQIREKIGADPAGMPTREKAGLLRRYREEMYEKLKDAVYLRRGWTPDGVPTTRKIRELGIDFDKVVAVIGRHQG